MWADFQIDVSSSMPDWMLRRPPESINLKSYLSRKKIWLTIWSMVVLRIAITLTLDLNFAILIEWIFSHLKLFRILVSSSHRSSFWTVKRLRISVKKVNSFGTSILWNKKVAMKSYCMTHAAWVMLVGKCLPIELLRVFVFQI